MTEYEKKYAERGKAAQEAEKYIQIICDDFQKDIENMLYCRQKDVSEVRPLVIAMRTIKETWNSDIEKYKDVLRNTGGK